MQDAQPIQPASPPPAEPLNAPSSPSGNDGASAPASLAGTVGGAGSDEGVTTEQHEQQNEAPQTTAGEGQRRSSTPDGVEVATTAEGCDKGAQGEQSAAQEDHGGSSEQAAALVGAPEGSSASLEGDGQGAIVVGEEENGAAGGREAEQASAMAPAIVEPIPSNPAATSALLASASDAGTAPSSASNGTSTPPPPPSSAPAATIRPGASPAPSVSPTPTAPAVHAAPTIAAPHLQKKFQSSLAVNKKFLEKAGEKAKPEVKPVATRVATPPAPASVSTSHPRLFAGKLSSAPSISLSASSAPSGLVGWKKPTSPAPGSTAPGASGTPAHAQAGVKPGLTLGKAGAPVWGAPSGRQQDSGMSLGMGGLGMGMGRRMDMTSDFPTAAEAAHAKEARARALAEQMQAREKEMQARAAAAAAHNAHLLEELDAFRGVHLNPNAAHWDEDEDDFLDTTIEFADGTQYKIVEDGEAAAAGDDELREPGPSELALLEKPLAPGEVVEPPKREERFGDDFDRSWPPRVGGAHDSKNLFNERIGRLEPAAAAAAAGLPKRPMGEPTSILSPPSSHRPLGAAERRTSDALPSVSHSHGHSGEPSRRRGSVTSPPRRRPSVTSPSMRTTPLPSAGSSRRESFGEQQSKPGAWGRRTSAEVQGRQLPPHLAGAGGAGGPTLGAGGRSLPPHLQHQQSARELPPVAPRAPLSPPTQRAPLPPLHAVPTVPPPRHAVPAASPDAAAPPPAPSAAAPAPVVPVADLEAEQARDMHAAAERAKKRREEEEQARKEQAERAKRKAMELEERMKKAAEAKKAEEAKVEEKKAEEAKASASASVSAPAPAPAAVPTPAISPPVQAVPPAATTSWRAAGKPLPPQAAAAQQALHAPPKILPREAVPPPSQPQLPTITPPSQSLAAHGAPPTQPSAWRRPSAPPTAPTRPQIHQTPPHMLGKQAEQPPAPVAIAPTSAVASTVEKAPTAPSAPVVPAPAAEHPAAPKPSTSPPAQLQAPLSPAQDRKMPAPPKAAFKQPAVSQFDDLMSRIKREMNAADEVARAPAVEAAAAALVAPTVKLPDVQKPEVKLPATLPSAAPPAPVPAATPPNPAPVVSLPPPTQPRTGRGRGRAVTPRPVRPAPPAFESREPLVAFPTTVAPRPRSPPPAWRQYTVRLAPYPPRRPPSTRLIKNFLNVHHPRPVNSLAFEPPMQQINTSRLTRDDWLMPKAYKRGIVQYSVRLPSGTFERRKEEEKTQRPTPSVSISTTPLKRARAPIEPEQVAEPARPLPALRPAHQVLGFVPPGRAGGASALDNGTWRPVGGPAVPTATLDDVQVAAENAEAVLATEVAPSLASGSLTAPAATPLPSVRNPHKKLPEGSSIGFYRPPGTSPLDELNSLPLDRSESAKMFMVTSELNGEKVETTPRKETTAPGAHFGASSPSSPVFAQQDINPLLSSPSSTSAWPSKSLVLNPTVASVWSAAPTEDAVHARVASGVQPENSLQGIADVDPIEALPNSLADLKSEDGISTEDKEAGKRTPPKDEAKLRAMAQPFSSFLHEQAGSVNSTPASPVAAVQPQPAPRPLHPAPFPGYPSQVPPPSAPSPINAYSPAQPYSPQLPPSLHYARPIPQPQPYSAYPLPTQNASPFVSQAMHHQAYSPQPFAPHSPALQTAGYPSSPYRGPTQPGVAPPQHITNPALLANYGYGQPTAASPARGFGAVGAVGAGGPGPVGRPLSGAAYGRPPHGQGPSSYPIGYGSPYQPPQVPPQPQPYRVGTESPYAFNAPLPAGSPDHTRVPPAPYNGSTTMASPVIIPQQLPQVPLFAQGSPVHPHAHYQPPPHQQHQQHQQHPSLPSAVSAAAGIGPYAGPSQPGGALGGYGAPGGFGRGMPQGRPNGAMSGGLPPGRAW
ncbi:hypothetical protein JCM10213_009257 [Rhodosporidiobolus nylandii]